MNRMSAAVARAPNELKSDNEMISRVEKFARDKHGSSSSGDVTPEAAVVRLGQDAVRGEHCGDGDCWRLSPRRILDVAPDWLKAVTRAIN